jgi:hypothetical protein
MSKRTNNTRAPRKARPPQHVIFTRKKARAHAIAQADQVQADQVQTTSEPATRA